MTWRATLHFQGATFSDEDRAAIRAKVQRQVGVTGPAASKLDALTDRVITAMSQGDRAGAERIAASRTSDELAAVANAVGASPIWEPPTPAEAGEAGPAELADQIIRR